MNWFSALLWGFAATVVLTGILTASQSLRWSRISIPFLLGTIFTPNRSRALWVGFVLHFLNGWGVALLYAALFESMGHAGILWGGLFGIAHGLFILAVLIPLLPTVHPRMATEAHGPNLNRGLQPPGFLALNYGRHTPLLTLLAHLSYGMILGFFYSV